MLLDEKDVSMAGARYEETRPLASTSESEMMGKTSSSFRTPGWGLPQMSLLQQLSYRTALAFLRRFQLDEPGSDK